MKNITLIADIIFLETAEKNFNFPIQNSIRISFWLPDSKGSTFSEVHFYSKNVEKEKFYRVEIIVAENDLLKDKIKENCDFYIGTYPYKIAYGKIIELKSQIEY